jgi:hypothetical protein
MHLTPPPTLHVVLFLGPWQIPGSMYVGQVANLKHGLSSMYVDMVFANVTLTNYGTSMDQGKGS